MRQLPVPMLVFVFALGIAAMGFAVEGKNAGPSTAAAKAEYKTENVKVEGTVTRIEGRKITFRDASGQETTIKSRKKGIAVGDTVIVDNGKIIMVVKVAPGKK